VIYCEISKGWQRRAGSRQNQDVNQKVPHPVWLVAEVATGFGGERFWNEPKSKTAMCQNHMCHKFYLASSVSEQVKKNNVKRNKLINQNEIIIKTFSVMKTMF
jgi:hypothetical protein